MMDIVPQIVAGAFLFAGAFFLLAGAIGMNRMPDLFTRMHAASVGDTLGVSLMLIGMVVLGGFTLVTVKLLFLLAFLLFMGPVASHALAAAALKAGVKPILAGKQAGGGKAEGHKPRKKSAARAATSGGGKP
ncbi:monovalent cation/H(+) antiporter subunit G [Kaistia adipata]|uniref:monovalent cation/H(+) antiporter subunit G n=1 Tax=Kaistia adipata TaxID=166954 RepID=UPI000427E741|nr:monovalent cation/H(+) antiporter subunit G [Kaistia adipata]